MVKRRRFPATVPYVVAAIDRHHRGRLATARRLVTVAADAGASAVKFSLLPDRRERPWPRTAWSELKRQAAGRLEFILAPHDDASFELARRVKPDVYQIDPAMLADLDLVRRIGRERKPVLVVAAGATAATIAGVIQALGRCPIVLLHSVMADVVAPRRARLQYIGWLSERFHAPAGYLGREPGVGWSFVAAALGAVVIEKLLTVDRSLPGHDQAAALEPDEFRALASGLRELREALAPVRSRTVLAEELAGLERDGRGLVARRALRQGHVIGPADIESRENTDGLSPRLSTWIVGRRLCYDVEPGDPLTFGLVELG